MRPFERAFDPVDVSLSSGIQPGKFTFLKEALTKRDPDLENCNVLNPNHLDIPWPTSFPAIPECKFWKDAEDAATTFIEEILDASKLEAGALPRAFQDPGSRATKKLELIETSAGAATYLFPSGNRKTAMNIAKASILIFLHDDLIESNNTEGITVLDYASSAIANNMASPPTTAWRDNLFKKFAQEVLEEDSVVGPKFIASIMEWVKHTRDNSLKNAKFRSLSAYIDFRIKDFAVGACNTGIMMACKINLSPTQMEPLSSLNRLFMQHYCLTNDLYSFNKELQEEQKLGSAMINGVRVLEEQLGVSSHTAKALLRVILWEIEAKLWQEYIACDKGGTLSCTQMRFARAMIETLAGNVFHLATTTRYFKAAS